VRKNASDLLVQSWLMHAPTLRFGQTCDASRMRELAEMAAQQRSEYRNCQDLSQAKLCFPHHKMLCFIGFDFLSTKATFLLKCRIVEKLYKLLISNDLH
jgi:hypothetical protein